MVEILPVLPQANVEAVRRQLARGRTPHVALALPEGWLELDNIARLRLLQRQAQIQRRHLALITRQESTRKLAESLGIPVFFEAADAQRRKWQMVPELPLVNPRKPAAGLPEPPPWRRADIVQRSAQPSHHHARQQRIRAEEAARRPLPYWTRFIGYFAMAALVALVLNFFVRNVLPAATITLVPGRSSMTVSVPLTADGSVETIDPENNVLPARFIEISIESTGAIATTGSEQKASDLAVGQVDFNNLGSAPVNIPAGTIVSTSTGTPVNFRTTVAATLEGGVGTRVTVPIEAEQPGIESNVRANTINTVNGALRFRVRVINTGGTGGGGAQLVRVVTQADRDNLLSQVQAEVEARAYEQLQKELQVGEWLPPESVQSFVTSSVFDKFNDDEGDTLNLNLRLLVQGTALNQEQTNEAVLGAVRGSVPPGGRLIADSVATRNEPGAVAVDRKVEFTVTAVADYVVPIDPREVSSAVAGLTPQEAVAKLTAQWPLASPPDIYRDPQWLETLPTLPAASRFASTTATHWRLNKVENPVESFPAQGKLLALDVGLARVGIAVCDPLRLAARPHSTLTRSSRRQDFAHLAAIVKAEEAQGVVCGLPLNMDGTAGPQAQTTRKWAMRLAQALRVLLGAPVAVAMWDERLSSYSARELAQQWPRQGEDALAATVILQSFLAEQKRGNQPSEVILLSARSEQADGKPVEEIDQE